MRFKLSLIIVSLMNLCLPAQTLSAETNIVNVYAWTGEIPDVAIHQFEKETGIKVNFSTYDNNEIMYAKLRAVKHAGYDVIMPSSYFVDRMRRQDMLEKLDKNFLPNWLNLNPNFLHSAYDPESQFCVPAIWGVTGIFLNDRYYKSNQITQWQDLWDQRFADKLLLLNDTREVFAMALLTLGYSVNESDPIHIKEAFLKLKELMKNVKVFSSDTVVSILIDEDATVGMAWNGDAFKAMQENQHIQFIFPQEGFAIWVDNFAIPKNAPHKSAAYAFINFMLRADVGKTIALATQFPTANLAAQQLLPAEIRNNPNIYPAKEVLSRGQFQTDLSNETLALYEKYWEELKMAG